MTTKPKNDGITLLPYRERVKLVRERLASMRHPGHTDLPKSQRVLAAEKVLHEYWARNEKAREASYAEHRRRKNEVQDALIVGDMARAVALMQRLGA